MSLEEPNPTAVRGEEWVKTTLGAGHQPTLELIERPYPEVAELSRLSCEKRKMAAVWRQRHDVVAKTAMELWRGERQLDSEARRPCDGSVRFLLRHQVIAQTGRHHPDGGDGDPERDARLLGASNRRP